LVDPVSLVLIRFLIFGRISAMWLLDIVTSFARKGVAGPRRGER